MTMETVVRFAMTAQALPKTAPAAPVAPAAAKRTAAQPVATLAPRPGAITRSGSGTAKTQAFELTGGDYVVSWLARNNHPLVYPTFTASLRSVSDSNIQEKVINVTIPAQTTLQGEGAVYNIKTGRYYFDVSTTFREGEWTIAISQT